VYHLTRSKEDVTRRQEYHGYAKSDFYRDFKLRREINEVIDGALAAWSLRIKTIIDIVRNRPTKDKIHAEMLVDQIQVDQKDSLRCNTNEFIVGSEFWFQLDVTAKK